MEEMPKSENDFLLGGISIASQFPKFTHPPFNSQTPLAHYLFNMFL